MSDLLLNVNARRAELERSFANLVRLRPVAVVTRCGWLHPSAFCVHALGAWWGDIVRDISAGMSPSDADAVVTAAYARHQLSDRDFDPGGLGQSPEGLAREIHRLAGVAAAGRALGPLALAVQQMDDTRVREIAGSIAAPTTASGDVERAGTLDTAAARLVEMVDNGNIVIRSGLPKFDRWVGGWPRGELSLIAGRPGMGKTVMGMQTAEYMARSGRRVTFFSLEMSREMLVARRASAISGVIWRDILTGTVSQDDRVRFQRAAEKWVSEMRNLLVYDTTHTVQRIWETAASVGADAVIVDHMSLISETRGENENLRQGRISATLKSMAKALNVPVIVLVQMSRAVAHRADKRPVLTDLRDSGEHEQNADNVIMLHRDDYYNPVPNVKIVPAEILILKFRNGPRMKLDVLFDEEKFWFLEP